MITQSELKSLLKYNFKTGNFTWRENRRPCIKAGDIAGHKGKNGYIQIKISGKKYLAHRLAFLYVKGYFPEDDVDHKNGNPSNNWWKNLREVSKTCNLRNTKNQQRNTSGIKGVVLVEKTDKWGVSIGVNGKGISLGHYSCFDEAVCVRLAAEQCLGWGGCDSSSPAYQYVNKNFTF